MAVAGLPKLEALGIFRAQPPLLNSDVSRPWSGEIWGGHGWTVMPCDALTGDLQQCDGHGRGGRGGRDGHDFCCLKLELLQDFAETLLDFLNLDLIQEKNKRHVCCISNVT